MIGNLIQQGPATENSTILTYREETTDPAKNPGMDLYVVNNTFVNQRPNGGTFVRAVSPALPPVIENNIFAGPGTLTNRTDAQLLTNLRVSDPAQAKFVDFINFDYHLTNTSPAINAGTQPGGMLEPLSSTCTRPLASPGCNRVSSTLAHTSFMTPFRRSSRACRAPAARYGRPITRRYRWVS